MADEFIHMETSQGPVRIQLRPDLAPGHVERIKELAIVEAVVFHRVIDGFMPPSDSPARTRWCR